jgi:hypothetical protein
MAEDVGVDGEGSMDNGVEDDVLNDLLAIAGACIRCDNAGSRVLAEDERAFNFER